MHSKQIQRTSDIMVHDFDRRIENTFMAIETELSQKNVEIIRKYDMEMVRCSLAKATRLKHLATLLSLTRILKKDWDVATKQDIDKIIYEVNTKYSTNGQETHTTWDHKKVLRIFFRWLKLGSRDSSVLGDPEETKYIRLKPVKNRIVREQLITEDDLSALLKACVGNPRDRAFLHVHFEAGTRPGEILNLKIKHVKFDKYGAFIYVDGKTNARPIRLVRSVPDLAQWFDTHPLKDNPDAPLWIILDQGRLGEPMTYWTAERLLARIVKRAKLNKKINLKLFRHSEATYSAKYLTESQMRIRHGWTSTSNMPSNYVHLVNGDVDSAYLKHFGIVERDEEKPTLPKTCHFCQIPNSIDAQICNKCGRPLDVKSAIKMEEETKQQNLIANKLAAKFLIQMLTTGQIPKVPKEELDTMLVSLNL